VSPDLESFKGTIACRNAKTSIPSGSYSEE